MSHLLELEPKKSLSLPSACSELLLLGGVLNESESASDPWLCPGDFLVRAGQKPLFNGGTERALVLVDSPLAPHAPSPSEPRRIGRDDLVGRPFSGVTGIRALSRTESSVAVRFGPPPGARWVIVGLRSVAVFVGKLVLIENGEPVEVHAGHLAIVSDPSATLYLQAGNDAAIGLGFAEPEIVVALG